MTHSDPGPGHDPGRHHEQDAGQPALLPEVVRSTARASRKRAEAREKKPPKPVAEVDPVASVLVDVPLAHLDRPFDYLVPADAAETARPGVRVKVRFAGQDVDGFVVARRDASEHGGTLRPLRRVVSAERVLHPEVATLTATVARRYAGTRGDVLRLAVPPRHATVEKQDTPPAPEPPAPGPALAAATAAWVDHEPAEAFLAHLAEGSDGPRPRAVWTAAPGADWPAMLATAAAVADAAGQGALICVPDGRDVDRVSAALTAALGEGRHVALRADAGPSRRYRDFLAVSRGAVRVVVGTRAAALAPVADLGLVAIWDDGDDLFSEPRAPYPHARETLLLRATQQDTAVLVGGFTRTVEGAQLVHSGWAHAIAPTRETLRARVSVHVAGADDREVARDPAGRAARFPTAARDLVRDALTGADPGPVLVQVPRAGYAPSLACETCRTPARCARCAGPLAVTAAGGVPTCRWCGQRADDHRCAVCGSRGLRAPVRGSDRTVEELGRALPGARMRSSSGEQVLATVGDEPAVVVATPGAEPVVEGDGYAAVVLLDTWLTLGRVDLRSDEEALRRWLGAAGLVRPGGRVVAVGDPSHPALQALVRWDPAGFADREVAVRTEAGLPPATRMASLTAAPDVLDEVLAQLDPPPQVTVLGPVPAAGTGPTESDLQRLVLRVPRADGTTLSTVLGDLQRTRSARKQAAVRVQVDPPGL
ncbi:primosomal protein N' [Nocardioides sp. CFH 31398]|uniref:primosomal protein N' n=1 Tax=Nocardioides sp. CFH 31398 TaxID=2919579 RepID=UPI001F062736|nr:primosomal protein N' [Nocardioides sp. CFH 31398]MCH1868573.1 primosomal protein N' [Nocardioides sp. CFH 31398]